MLDKMESWKCFKQLLGKTKRKLPVYFNQINNHTCFYFSKKHRICFLLCMINLREDV